MLLPAVHFPIDNLLSHLMAVFNLHCEEDNDKNIFTWLKQKSKTLTKYLKNNNKNEFIGFDPKYQKLTKYLFPDCDLKDDQILKYNKLRNSLHGNYADLNGKYQLVNLRDLLDL